MFTASVSPVAYERENIHRSLSAAFKGWTWRVHQPVDEAGVNVWQLANPGSQGPGGPSFAPCALWFLELNVLYILLPTPFSRVFSFAGSKGEMELLLPSDVLIMSSGFGWVITGTWFMWTSAWDSLATLTFPSVSKAVRVTHSVTEKSQAVGSLIFVRTPAYWEVEGLPGVCSVWQRAVVAGISVRCAVYLERGLGSGILRFFLIWTSL